MSMGPGTLANIINSHWPEITKEYNSYQVRTLNAIRRCRTPALGGSLYRCDDCGGVHKRYHSCRNRHCSQCQNTQRERWIQAQESKLIETRYYHVVFTIPDSLYELFMNYPRELYALLMRTAWQTLDGFGWNSKYLGAQLGCTMMLHTWGSNMSYHPHVHCIVPGGGVDLGGKWRNVKSKGKFLYPVKALSKVFRGKLVSALSSFLEDSGMAISTELRGKLYKKAWVVYAKPSFGGAQSVIKYLARYSSKIAITHHRIVSHNDQMVSFSYTDYRHQNQKKVLSLSCGEFIRRFVLHILPKGFSRIHHYGILSSAWSKRMFAHKQNVSMTVAEVWIAKGIDISQCPSCKKGRLIYEGEIEPARGPPRMVVGNDTGTISGS